jgi:hypothetical protein
VLAAGVALTVWLVSRSNSEPAYRTPGAAVIAACHADPAQRPVLLVGYTQAQEHGLEYVWQRTGDTNQRHLQLAIVSLTDPRKFHVVTCTATVKVPTGVHLR